MTRSETLTEDDVRAVASDLGVSPFGGPPDDPAVLSAKARVDADERSFAASGGLITPTFGHLAGWRSAALPVAGAIGGTVAPAALYLLVVSPGPWSHGWGVPMSTDTAFAVALIVMLGPRVPVELRIFLTAASIVDDLCATSSSARPCGPACSRAACTRPWPA
jgi:hypothetical protein